MAENTFTALSCRYNCYLTEKDISSLKIPKAKNLKFLDIKNSKFSGPGILNLRLEKLKKTFLMRMTFL